WNICSIWSGWGRIARAGGGVAWAAREYGRRRHDDRTAGELRRLPAPPDRDRAALAQASSPGCRLRARAPRRIRARHRLRARARRRGAGLDPGALRPDVGFRRLLRAAGGVSLAPAQPLARLFRAPEGAARERPRQRRSDPPAVRIRRFRGGLDRAAARGGPARRTRPRGRRSRPREDDLLPRPEAVVLRRPLSDLRALPARRPGLAHRQCRRARA